MRSALLTTGAILWTAVSSSSSPSSSSSSPPPPSPEPNTNPEETCKCLPSDPCWPPPSAWSALNATIINNQGGNGGGSSSGSSGTLIHHTATTLLGSPCHSPSYDAAACSALADSWLAPPVHLDSSSSVMAPLFVAGAGCDPFTTGPGEPCSMESSSTGGGGSRGMMMLGYTSYAVEARDAADVLAAVEFAEAWGLRLVVRNTGHDYLGRSTGYGALGVWTRGLKGTEILDWDDDARGDGSRGYVGKALKMGAGTLGFEALAAAREEGLVVVTGECPSVGIAGGYTQGGGHSALSSAFGLAADNVLEFEVVVPGSGQPDGKPRLVTASPRSEEHADLYWALAGGGAGNYGVVTSMTVQAHPDARVSGASWQWTVPQGANLTDAEKTAQLHVVVDAWHAALPRIAPHAMAIYYFGPGFFSVPALTVFSGAEGSAEAILEEFVESLAAAEEAIVIEEPTYTEFESYHEHFDHYWGPAPAGNILVGESLFGGRLVPRDVIEEKPGEFSEAAKTLVDMGVTFIGVGLDVSSSDPGSGVGSYPNAVLPQWRDSLIAASLTLPYSFDVPVSQMWEAQGRITNEIQPVIEAVTPGAGVYMNEADFQQPDWKEAFFGENYEKLLEIKRRYDPRGVLYVLAGVGSDMWEVMEGEDGKERLCQPGEVEKRGKSEKDEL